MTGTSTDFLSAVKTPFMLAAKEQLQSVSARDDALKTFMVISEKGESFPESIFYSKKLQFIHMVD